VAGIEGELDGGLRDPPGAGSWNRSRWCGARATRCWTTKAIRSIRIAAPFDPIPRNTDPPACRSGPVSCTYTAARCGCAEISPPGEPSYSSAPRSPSSFHRSEGRISSQPSLAVGVLGHFPGRGSASAFTSTTVPEGEKSSTRWRRTPPGRSAPCGNLGPRRGSSTTPRPRERAPATWVARPGRPPALPRNAQRGRGRNLRFRGGRTASHPSADRRS